MSEILERLGCRRPFVSRVRCNRHHCVAATSSIGAGALSGGAQFTHSGSSGWVNPVPCRSLSAPRVTGAEGSSSENTVPGSVKPNDFTSPKHSRTNELLGPVLTIHFSSSKCKSLVKRPQLHQLVCTKCFGV